MSEINYSKKQLNPLIEKFKINAETNEVFHKIIEMFDNQTPYQIWAIKAVFGGICPIELIARIKDWAENNQTEIQNLIKKNIIAYKTKGDFSTLMDEMNGLDRIARTRNTINKFNTRQREMLKEAILSPIKTGLDALSSPYFKEWDEILAKMETLVKHRKEKLISTSSAIDDIAFLKEHIKTALAATYEWVKDDMLSFMARNASDCKIVFDGGDVVVLNIPSFKSSKLLCGNGRTGWCLTRQDSYFKQYVLDPKDAKQYFLFDFSKREDDELAHIGFTVRRSEGITNAHSTKNYNLLGSGISYKGKNVNITQALKMCNVPTKIFMPMKDLRNFRWDMRLVLDYISQNQNDLAICVCENNRIVVRPLTANGLTKMVSHTFVNTRDFSTSGENKVYIILDFNLSFDDDKSVVVIGYSKDNYHMDSLRKIVDGYNANITQERYLDSIGLSSDKFLNREEINPSILLHKLIDEKNETEAVALIAKEGDNFDVNFEFNQNVPVFSAIENKLYRVFEAIINHKKFDCTTCDSFGESLLQSLMFNYMPESSNSDRRENEAVKQMINTILDSENFDFNVQDINLDTAINIACDRKELLWIVERLASKPNVNINIVNDFNYTALGTAIRKKNIDAIRILSRRPDLVVREEDFELAKQNGVNLSELLSEDVLNNVHKESEVRQVNENGEITTSDDLASDLSKIFAKAFSARR